MFGQAAAIRLCCCCSYITHRTHECTQLEGYFCEGFWRHEQDALLASYHDSISGLALKLSSANRGVYTTQQVSLRADGSEGCSGVALLGSHGSDAGLLAFGLARQMLLTGR